MVEFVRCVIGQGDALATGGLGLVAGLILYAHVEKLTAPPPRE